MYKYSNLFEFFQIIWKTSKLQEQIIASSLYQLDSNDYENVLKFYGHCLIEARILVEKLFTDGERGHTY